MNSTIEIQSGKAHNYLNNSPWTLVLGAGICKGIMPDWQELTLNIVNEVFSFNWDREVFKEKTDEVGFSLDGWLQAALNRKVLDGKSVDDFNDILEEKLYGPLLEKTKPYALDESIKYMIHNPHNLKKNELLKIVDFFDSEYTGCTLLQIVNFLLDSDTKLKRPESVITFNADPLLQSLLIVYGVKRNLGETGKYEFPVEDYVRVTRPFQYDNKKIPVLHLHGAIFPRLSKGKKRKPDSRDNLIFSESSYTETAGIMNSWAQNVFSCKSTHSRMVFVGLSMSDPNIRRWLSWSAGNISSQLKEFTKVEDTVLTHLWVRPKPKEKEMVDFYSTSLVHLSTKPCWLDNWDSLGKGMLNMMGKKDK